MSSFFTLPASRKKRKRQPNEPPSAAARAKDAKRQRTRDESISGSDESGDELPAKNGSGNDEDQDDDDSSSDEDLTARRVRLAEQYLANTQKAVLDDFGFDAAEIDAEHLRRRMGERLKEDNIENKWKLYRWVAGELDWRGAGWSKSQHHQKSITGVAIAGGDAYTVGKDSILVKWRIPSQGTEEASDAGRIDRLKKMLVSRPFGKQIDQANVDGHKGSILCVAASSDGQFVVTGGADKKIIVWAASTLSHLKTFTQHRGAVISLAFRRNTNQLFSASKDRTVKIWSLDELAYIETLFGHQDEVVDVSALAQEQCITVGARDRTARLWKVVEESQLVFRGGGAPGHAKTSSRTDHAGGVRGLDGPSFNEGSMDRVACIDNETFITASDNGSISLWNIFKKKAVFTYPLAHGIDRPVPLEQFSAELEPDARLVPNPQPRWVTALRAIPFSDTFVTGSWDGYVRAWKISSDKRRIEALGPIGCIEERLQTLLEKEGLSSESLSNGALQAMKDGEANQGRVPGCVNDLAIVERGDRMQHGVMIIAAVGKEHRLGRWTEIEGSKNHCVLFAVPRKALDGTDLMDAKDERVQEDTANSEGFVRFD